MRFAQLIKGTRAVKPVTFSIWGSDAKLAVRPMTGLEEGEAYAAARAYAVSKGVADPKPTDRIYEIGVMANTIAIACVDVEAHETRYFSNANEVLDNLDTDRIAYLFEAQQLWQDECSPLVKSMTEAQWAAKIIEVTEAAEEVDFLSPMRPVMRLAFLRLTVSRLFRSLTDNSGSSTVSADAPTNSANQSDG